MWDLGRLAKLPVSLLLCLPLITIGRAASPSIDVTLQASFPAPPFLVELLETAAAENQSSYLPLLDTIASGRFASCSTDEQLYTHFLQTLQSDGHITNPSTLSSFKLALAVHEAAPRIEAHYQFWRSSGIWPAKDGEVQRESGWGLVHQLGPGDHKERELDFDRRYGDATAQDLYTLYVDPTSAMFARIYPNWRQVHGPENTAFRIRYMPPTSFSHTPLVVNGYGIELALKRTDYIVIDDRQAAEEKTASGTSEVNLSEEEDVADLKPLSSSELLNLGLNAASFIMASEDPLDTLAKITQDFPKHAAALALHETSADFITEHGTNREQLLPSGYNVIWINGVQVDDRSVDAFSLLEHLRRERKLISNVQDLGFKADEVVALLSNEEIAKSASGREPQRYDWRDDNEGGSVILWLNDIEKDKRYAAWPSNVTALLQRTFPGQLPQVRKDIQNVIFPLDFTDRGSIITVVETLQQLVKRTVAARFGIVPAGKTQAALDHAKILRYLEQFYGLSAVMQYLELSLRERKFMAGPSETAFEHITSDNKLRKDREAIQFKDVLQLYEVGLVSTEAQKYLARLGADGPSPPFFVNGVPIVNDENWMQVMSQQIGMDLMNIQQGVYEGRYSQDMWLPGVFLEKATLKRNPLIIPEDEADVKLFDVSKLFAEHADEMNALLPAEVANPVLGQASLIVVADLNSRAGAELALNAMDFVLNRKDVDVALKHQCTSSQEPGLTAQGLQDMNEILTKERPDFENSHRERIQRIIRNLWLNHMSLEKSDKTKNSQLVASLGLKPGQRGILLNGRFLVIPKDAVFKSDDFDTLLTYERKKRIDPIVAAVEALGLADKVNTPQALAKLSSLVALSLVSDVPEGIYDSAPGPRMDVFNKWKHDQTCIQVGDKSTAVLQVAVSLDPSSEIAQRWVPILQVLASLDGVYSRIWLNPKEKIQELPVKRFYRQVLEASPRFGTSGELLGLGAHFTGIPRETLLTMTMDTPPSWLVAPEESVYDLDNIKLSSLKPGTNVEAIYELENILIEGHSRDTTTGQPPRGVQLALETDTDSEFASTIIMANLGYFQFKANPGVYNLALKAGRSKEIFNIDSLGTTGDDTTEISLTSFQGATVFPKLSRRAGKELEDVLEEPTISAEAVLSKGAALADDVLSKVGVPKGSLSSIISKGLQISQSLLGKAGLRTPSALAPKKQHADINIFSVASGHLYERMLNIMMLSVMKHTTSSVKFWFIEQFLSPSFKAFLPTLAAEYNFQYEMVTYKWPHWLRAQKEKQRVIWGYKILFLDVLFPLDLDKVIFVDADQIVRTDMIELVRHDLEGAPYGFTPMCDSRTEMEGFRFWKQGYWKNFLRGLPYHISALYVVDLKRFRQIAAGDRLRGQYHQLSADPNSLSNLDQDLPNHMQMALPIHSLPQDWLWCETWCSDEALSTAKTIDLCNNPLTKEPKLERARRQVPEWTVYDEEIAGVARRVREGGVADGGKGGVGGDAEVGGKDEGDAGARVQQAEDTLVGEDVGETRGRDEL